MPLRRQVQVHALVITGGGAEDADSGIADPGSRAAGAGEAHPGIEPEPGTGPAAQPGSERETGPGADADPPGGGFAPSAAGEGHERAGGGADR